MVEFTYIKTQEQLESLCNILAKESKIAFDCEFIRETTFVPVLCLMQIATERKIYIIDPIKLNLDPFLPLLTNNKILKIMHSAIQDIDVFFKNFSVIPKPIFDTQIAASFLGYGDSISYAKLVKTLTGEVINKDNKLTHWQKRPLDKAQINYALLDVKYLFVIYGNLYGKLQDSKRYKWFIDEVDNLYYLNNYYVCPEEAWKRVNSSGNRPFFFNYLQAFAKLREEIAVASNRPRRFIIKDETLIQLANLQPKCKEDILNDRILQKFLSRNIINQILKVSLEINKTDQELISTKHKKLSGNKALICDYLKIFLKYTANKYDIAAKYIAKTEELEDFIQEEHDGIRFLSGWRYEIFGKGAKKIITGRMTLKIINKKLLFCN